MPNIGGKEYENIEGINVYRVGKKIHRYVNLFSYTYSFYKKAASLSKNKSYSAMHCNTVVGVGLAGYMLKKRFHIPLVFTVHHFGTGIDIESPTENPFGANFLTKQLLKRADSIITASKTQMDFVNSLDNFKRRRMIPPGVDVSSFSPDKSDKSIKDKYSGHKLIFSAGRFVKRKNFSDLIGAAGIVCEKYPNVKFLIAGKGPEWENVNARIKKDGLEDNAILLGFLNDEELSRYYATCDLFASTSLYEGFGLIYIESMSSGTPVVCYHNEAASEIFEKFPVGYTTNQNPEELANRIIKLLDDDALLKELGKKAREVVKNNYTWDLCAKKYDNEFRDFTLK